MPNYAKLAKGLTSLMKGSEDVLPAAEREANKARFLESSKVKQPVYHGTMSDDVKEFRTPAYFGGKDVANQFADPEYLYGTSKLEAGESPNVIPAYLNLKNPKVFTKEADYEKHVIEGGLDTQRWIKKGHDGIIYAPNGDMTSPDAYFVAFEPSQIKSAVGNRGTYSASEKDITKAKGGAIRMQVGGLSALANIGKAAKAGSKLSAAEVAALRARGMGVPSIDFADPLNPKDVMRMSEALGISGAEGKTLNLTQADRSRVFGPNKGGTGFSGLQLTSEPHQQANTTWGVGKPSHVTRLINANTPETVWSTFIGSPTQHMSNPVTMQRMYEAHRASNPSAELIEKMNAQLNSAVNPKTKKPIFTEGIDISDPSALDKATTFDQRKAIAQAMTIGGEKKGEKATQEAFKIIKEETDPLLTEAPTYAVGNRLFTIDQDTGIYRPDLNAAFPHQVTGTDLGLLFEPAPIELAAPDFVSKYANRLNKSGKPQPMGHKDLTATTPKQFISEDYLTNLQKEGYKDGGDVTPSFTQRLQSALETHMAGGGVVNMSDTTPDNTDGGNIIQHSFYAEGGKIDMPVRSLKQVKPRNYADAGYVDPLGAPDYQTSPQDARMVELAGRMIKNQAAKEGAVLSTPEGRRDIALKVASHLPALGMGGDLVALADWVQTLIPGLYEEKPTSVLDTKKPAAPYRDVRELERVPKFPLRSVIGSPTGEEFQEKFKEAGLQGENEAPVTELIGSLFAPNALAKIPKMARGMQGGLNSMVAPIKRQPSLATR